MSLVAGCGGSTSDGGQDTSDEFDAKVFASTACFQFAQVFVDTVGGDSELTRAEGEEKVRGAANLAKRAAKLDAKWDRLADRLDGLADGMSIPDNDLIRNNLPPTANLCDPLVTGEGAE